MHVTERCCIIWFRPAVSAARAWPHVRRLCTLPSCLGFRVECFMVSPNRIPDHVRTWVGAGGQQQQGIVASENEIAFENACVVTPANATLVKDLNLRVPAGTNLLVTGPNGSGAAQGAGRLVLRAPAPAARPPSARPPSARPPSARPPSACQCSAKVLRSARSSRVLPLLQASRACSGCWAACGRWRVAAS